MHRLLLPVCLLLSFSVFAQAPKTSYPWNKVDELIHFKHLPRTALPEVKKIYARAKAGGDYPTVIKALIYIIGLQEEITEDYSKEAITQLEKERATAKGNEKAIITSLLADQYDSYNAHESNATFDRNDPDTWSAADLKKKAAELYSASLENKTLLQHTNVADYDTVIEKGRLRYLRPTLYDLLAHRALYFFYEDESRTLPVDAFVLTDTAALAPAAVFVAHRFLAHDTASNGYKLVRLYQEMVAFHLHDARPDALIDIDLNRLQNLHERAAMANREQLYVAALQELMARYGLKPYSVTVWNMLAHYYQNRGENYSPIGDTAYHYDRVKAAALYKRVLAEIKDSTVYGYEDASGQLNVLNHQLASFELMNVNIPGQPFLSRISYRNTDHIFIRILKLKNDELETWPARDEKILRQMAAAKPLREWKQPLPDPQDLQDHGVEIKIDALPAGTYLMAASIEGRFGAKDSTADLQLLPFTISRISCIYNDDDFFLLDRETGQPLAGVKASEYEAGYYSDEKHLPKLIKQYTADAHGYIKIGHIGKGYSSRYLRFNMGVDTLSQKQGIYDRSYSSYPGFNISLESPEERNATTRLFTDRGIYRPGQAVFFKGIVVMDEDSAKPRLMRPGFSATVVLTGANDQLLDSVTLRTNEFGSFNGRFQLPAHVLPGQFRLTVHNRTLAYFSVEEYKRPKFSISFDSVKQAYRLGDKVQLTGKALAFAGNTISSAQVKYTVTRTQRFDDEGNRESFYNYASPDAIIVNGATTTDAAGNFIIPFTALPDLRVDSSLMPVFSYSVEATVTDINGETHESSTQVLVGYTSLLLDMSVDTPMDHDSLKSVKVFTKNANAVFQQVPVQLEVFPLQADQRLVHPRIWVRPDQYIMSREEFIRQFPHDEWNTESDPQTWPRGEKVLSLSANSRSDGYFSVGDAHLPAGFYYFEVSTKDAEGHTIKKGQVVELFDNKATQLAYQGYFRLQPEKLRLQPGQTAKTYISSATNIFLISRKEKGTDDKDLDAFRFRQFGPGVQTETVTATEEDRGSFSIRYFFVRDNRCYQFIQNVYVPWSNKELKVEYTRFRNKTLPGSKEEWTLKVSGPEQQAAAAEVLASMYDASLDDLQYFSWWLPRPWPERNAAREWTIYDNFSLAESRSLYTYPFDFDARIYGYDNLTTRMDELLDRSPALHMIVTTKGGSPQFMSMPQAAGDNEVRHSTISEEGVKDETLFVPAAAPPPPGTTKDDVTKTSVVPRKNLQETAFFLPDLRTDSSGSVTFSFTVPEALTRWKMQALAHTKDLSFGLAQQELTTSKDLMVQPNLPRFLRQGDHIELSTKVVNTSASELTGQVQLELTDAATGQSVDGWFLNTFPNQYFTVAAGGSEVARFPVQVPAQFTGLLSWRLIASTTNGSITLSDGEEDFLPVLSNRVLVTETLPLPMKANGTQVFHFDPLLKSASSETLQNQSLTVEYTANPAWYVVQALPYLMTFPYECAEQTWNRYYANLLAGKIVRQVPAIRDVLNRWQTTDTSALISNLQKNEALTGTLLAETPWVMDAQSETARKKNIAVLYDSSRLRREAASAFSKLSDMVNEHHGLPWFKGGTSDRYITQYILAGIGRLKKLGIITSDDKEVASFVSNQFSFLDDKIIEEYKDQKKKIYKGAGISALQIQYLYVRSFFPHEEISSDLRAAIAFYRDQSIKNWGSQSIALEAMTALALQRDGQVATAKAIVRSLRERSIYSEELGRHWKDNTFGLSWSWWMAPIETQALLIETFNEVGSDVGTIEEMKTWLLRNKQTNNWSSTRATADACYALLLQGYNWLGAPPQVHITLGNIAVNTPGDAEAGSGYFRTGIEAQKINPQMGNVSVTVAPAAGRTPVPSWGSVYWQYFEDVDKVSASANAPLRLAKKLMLEKQGGRGPELLPVQEGTPLHIGDKVHVLIELKADRDMDYVQVKDMRASVLEPVSVLSGYDWKNGLYYYNTTGDLSTNYFIDYLPRGTYVFDYVVTVTHTGECSNGLATAQCLYAPEFSAHTESVKISVE